MANEMVQPRQGGLSVSPFDPMNLPRHRRPAEFGGTGRDPVWIIEESGFGTELQYRADPLNPGHGFVEPSHPMTLADFESAVALTQPAWRKLLPAHQSGASHDSV
jgi:hypothetical protein